MSDTSLVFNLVARDRASSVLSGVGDKVTELSTAIGAAAGAALAYGVTNSLDVEAANDKLAAQLGLSEQESARIGKVAGGLYADAYGGSMEEVNAAVGAVMGSIQGMTDASSAELQTASEQALNFASTFDIDVNRAVQSVGTLMKSGLAKNSTEAFDLITAASQKVPASLRENVLDASDEYGQFFHSLGFDGPQAFAVLADASAKGEFGIDKAGDAIKEFTIRSTDMSTSSQAAYKAIGLDAHQMANAILAGGDSAEGATQQIIDGLLNIKDPATQANAAIGLFGTPLEDMNVTEIPAFLQSLKGASGSMDDFGGAAKRSGDALNGNAKTALTSFKRGIEMDLTEIGGKLASFAMDHQNVVKPLAITLGILAGAVLVIRGGMMAWAAAQAAWSAATAIATGVQWAWNSALFASPITWIIIAIIALVAIIVLIATKTTWFQTIWSVVWGAIKAVVAMHVNAIKAVIGWFAALPGLFAGWFGAAKNWAVQKFTALVTWLTGFPGRALAAINSLNVFIGNKAIQAGNALKNAVVNRALSLINWMGGLGSRTVRAVGNFHSLLYNKGRDVITGLWNGISGMGGWLWSKVTSFVRSNVVDAAKSFLHIGSPSKLMADQIGHWIPAGIAEGAENNAGVVDTAIRNMTDLGQYRPAPASVGMAPFAGTAAASGGRPLTGTMRLVNSSADPFMDWLKERIRVDFGGDVTALNSGR